MIVALLLLSACTSPQDEPCADLCTYVCACHDGEEGFDCAGCRNDPRTDQDACADELEALRATDQERGTGCPVGGDTAGG